MFSLFVNVGIALYIGKIAQCLFLGFIIMSLFYLLIAFILYKFRHQLIHKTIGSSIIDQLLDQVNVEDIIQGNEKENEKGSEEKLNQLIQLFEGKNGMAGNQSCIA